MKQFTTPEQTDKLIELGFEKPRCLHNCELAYNVGELIEMLQKQVSQIDYSGIPCDLNIHYDGGTWLIVYICERDGRFKTERLDLINALYDIVVKLKEEGAI